MELFFIAVGIVGGSNDAASSCTSFGLDIYKEVVKNSPLGNVIVSPASLCIATTMVANAAHHNTVQQIRDAMAANESTLNAAFGRYLLEVSNASRGANDSDILLIANRMFIQQGHPILSTFRETMANHYRMETLKLDFGGNPEGSRQSVNAWVNDTTRSKIPELLKAGDISADTVLVLINAIYFKSTWMYPFRRRSTQPRPFKGIDSKTYDVDMMNNPGQKFNFTVVADLNASVIELPYTNNMSMFAILPLEGTDLPTVESRLTDSILTDILSGRTLVERSVSVMLPRMNIKQSSNMRSILPTLGVRDLFDQGKADLSRLDGTQGLFVSAFVHAATVTVNEEGSEASAATAIVGGWRSAWMGEVFFANKPFLFVIADKRRRLPLFLARYALPPGDANPATEE